MRWPFTRSRPHAVPPPPAAPSARPAPSRRDWAALPPMEVAGAKPISLTAGSRAFADQLASRQEMARTTRPVHARRPAGATLHGVLTPSLMLAEERSAEHAPDASAAEHRRPSAQPATGGVVEAVGEQALAQ